MLVIHGDGARVLNRKLQHLHNLHTIMPNKAKLFLNKVI